MGQQYGLPNKERTDIIKWDQVGRKRREWFVMPDGEKITNPQEHHFSAAGYLPENLIPSLGRRGTVLIGDKDITYEPVTLDPNTVKSDKINVLMADIRNLLRSTANTHGYDNIDCACVYAGSPNPFREESMEFVSWRGNVWNKFYLILNEVKDKKRELPTSTELLEELPVFTGVTRWWAPIVNLFK